MYVYDEVTLDAFPNKSKIPLRIVNGKNNNNNNNNNNLFQTIVHMDKNK